MWKKAYIQVELEDAGSPVDESTEPYDDGGHDLRRGIWQRATRLAATSAAGRYVFQSVVPVPWDRPELPQWNQLLPTARSLATRCTMECTSGCVPAAYQVVLNTGKVGSLEYVSGGRSVLFALRSGVISASLFLLVCKGKHGASEMFVNCYLSNQPKHMEAIRLTNFK